jgi:hypothetical protein
MAGNAATTMLVFSRGSLGAAPTDPVDPLDPLAHPAASVRIATADAMIAFRDFISLQMSIDSVACDPQRGLKASRDILAPRTARYRSISITGSDGCWPT